MMKKIVIHFECRNGVIESELFQNGSVQDCVWPDDTWKTAEIFLFVNGPTCEHNVANVLRIFATPILSAQQRLTN
jgi:hypothetical protein